MADGGLRQFISYLLKLVRYDNGSESDTISAQIFKPLAVRLKRHDHEKKPTIEYRKMTSLITIREYETSDKNDVINLFKLNTPEFFATDEEEDLKKYLETERELYYVLLYDEKIVGCGGINFADDKTIGKISWDLIHPDYQRKSLGTKLLRHRIDKLNSIDSIQKITVRTSQIAYRFYEKKGFELFEIIKDYWADGFDMYNMEYKQH